MPSRRIQLALITVGGIGYVPFPAGTFGSMPPVLLSVLLVRIAAEAGWGAARWLVIELPLVLLAAVATFVCLKFGLMAEQHFGKKDPRHCVADEVAGQCIALLFLPWREWSDSNAQAWNWAVAGIALLAFRLTDIIKPPPARGLQRLPAGAGIVIDDLIAGVYALILAQLATRFILPSYVA